jgi:hypothetical protein
MLKWRIQEFKRIKQKILSEGQIRAISFLADSDFTDDAKQIPDSEIIFYFGIWEWIK